ncbi:hypothetical protein [Bremerella cremea]|uniref:hypothetical protein n=1 Tax=Bremerella cremea TaxID=1031537 RepID=UPI0018F39616|nr:hypothetical protein [Bremerella cremea]
MALRKRAGETQAAWVASTDLLKSPGHVFYKKLNQLLAGALLLGAITSVQAGENEQPAAAGNPEQVSCVRIDPLDQNRVLGDVGASSIGFSGDGEAVIVRAAQLPHLAPLGTLYQLKTSDWISHRVKTPLPRGGRAIACSIPIKTGINLVQHRLVPAGAEAFSADVIFDGSVLL